MKSIFTLKVWAGFSVSILLLSALVIYFGNDRTYDYCMWALLLGIPTYVFIFMFVFDCLEKSVNCRMRYRLEYPPAPPCPMPPKYK